jgi:hypothetical protein
MTYRDPPQGLLDYLSRKDELQVRTNQLLEKVLAALVPNPSNPSAAIPTQQLQSLKSQLESGQYIPYNVRTFDMTTAQTDYPVTLQGYNLVATSDGVLSGVTVKFNSSNNDALPLQYFSGKSIPFTKLLLSWTAQPGKTLYLIIGNADTEFDLAQGDALAQVIGTYTRWGKLIVPGWVYADEVTAPLAGAALVTQTVTAGKTGYIFGAFIEAQEANDIVISWTSGSTVYSRRLTFGSGGALEFVDPIAINDGLPADTSSDITITVVNAGGAGKIYQANLLYGEV